MLAQFFKFVGRLDQKQPRIVIGPQKSQTIGPPRSSGKVIGPSTPIIIPARHTILVKPPRRGVWEEQGWSRTGQAGHLIYTGQFQVAQQASGRKHSFQGRIEVTQREPVSFIANPPASIRSHHKGPCFMLVSDGWFRIHWHRPPQNVDDAILYVEQILSEVLN